MDPLGVSRKMWAGSTSREWQKHSVDIHCILRIFQGAICFPPIFFLFKLYTFSSQLSRTPGKINSCFLAYDKSEGTTFTLLILQNISSRVSCAAPWGKQGRGKLPASLLGGCTRVLGGEVERGWGKGEMFTGTLALQCDKFAHAICRVSCARPETCGGEGTVGESHAGSQP